VPGTFPARERLRSFPSEERAPLRGIVITVTLGTPSAAANVTTAAGTATMRYNATATITDLAGNAASTANCNETGVADVDF
jgi:hypothetical protein